MVHLHNVPIADGPTINLLKSLIVLFGKRKYLSDLHIEAKCNASITFVYTNKTNYISSSSKKFDILNFSLYCLLIELCTKKI